MATKKLNISVDEETTREAAALFESLGLTMSAAVNIFFKRAILERGIPFEVSERVPNSMTAEAIEEGRRIARDKNIPGYDSVAELRAAMGV